MPVLFYAIFATIMWIALDRKGLFRPRSSDREDPEVLENTVWLGKCPICKLGKLVFTTKTSLFGLVTVESFECDSCGAVFTKRRGKCALSKVSSNSDAIWGEYVGQSLTETEWKNIATGGMSNAKQKEVDMENWVTQLKEGNTPAYTGGRASVILKGDEETKLVLSDISLLEPRAVRSGGYGGPSFRIAKGVSLKVGGFRSESHDELRKVDQGTLVLTNKRFIFSGAKRTVATNLGKIVSVEPHADAIALRRTGKGKTQYFASADPLTFNITVGGRSYAESFSGPKLWATVAQLIGGLIRRAED